MRRNSAWLFVLFILFVVDEAWTQTAVDSPPASPSPEDLSREVLRLEKDLDVTVRTQEGPPRFVPKEIRVKAGQVIYLTFINLAPSGSGILHNWILVEPGRVDEVIALGADAGIDAGGILYEPAAMAATQSLRPGESVTISFIAPEESGQYSFISSVGEQAKTMRGTLIVESLK